MTKRPTRILLALTAVVALAGCGSPSVGLTRGALAAPPSDGWYRFSAAGAVVKREDIVPEGVTLVTLSNGVTMLLKPTKLVADEVLVNVAVDGGHQSLEPGSRAAAELAEAMFVEAGVGLKTQEQLVAAFGPAASSIEFDIWPPRFNFGAKARPTELRSLLEVLTAYVSDPGWRFGDLEAAKAAAIENAAVVRSNATIALQAQSPGVLTSGDPRYLRPTEAQIRAVDEGAARRSIERRLKSGSIDITIVGDFDLEATIAMVAGTFGSLPARADAPAPSAPRFPPHTAAPIEIFFKGDPKQQGRQVAWPVPLGLFKSKEEQVISAMLGVMIYRLMELPAYEKTGFRKGVNAHNGYLAISAVGSPEALGSFDADVARVARDIVARGVTQAEIDRAQAVGAGDGRLMQSTVPNLYWLIELMALRGDRKNWENAMASLSYAQEVTPDEVQQTAARYLNPDLSVSMIARPETAPVNR